MEQPRAKRALITDHFSANSGSANVSSKDFTTSFASPTHSQRYPEVADDVQSQLMQVGMRARKAVSEGYKTKTSFPSYQGAAVGTMNFVDFNSPPPQSTGPTPAGKSATVADSRAKRTRDDYEEQGGDGIVYGSMFSDPNYNRDVRRIPVPASTTSSVADDDFEEADFLRAQ